MANSQSLSFEEVHEFVDGLFAGNLHAKRVLSLANPTKAVQRYEIASSASRLSIPASAAAPVFWTGG